MKLERWHNLMQSFGFAQNETTYTALVNAYREPQRAYHTEAHLDDCLTKFALVRSDATHAHEIELALWFHDAVYQPYQSGNEEKSAAWALDFLQSNQAPPDVIARVEALILATKHNAPATTNDATLLVDCDLSILGAPSDEYDLFEKNIRREYRWVPFFLYRKKRVEILQSFSQREPLYLHPKLAAMWEAPAKANLARAIEVLRR
jgi:predicted metal-dependent HD superfamily phosphohydrolase